MPKPTQEQITTAYWALPQEIRNFLYAEENVSHIEQIEKKFTLDDDQTSKLAKLSGEVIMGVVHLDAFAGEIRQRLTVDMIKAYDIAKEVSLSIFSKITPWMEKIHTGEKLERQAQGKPTMIPPPRAEIPISPKPEAPIPRPQTPSASFGGQAKPPEPKLETPPRPLTEAKEALIQKPSQPATSDKQQVTRETRQETGTPDTYREPIPPEDLPVVEDRPLRHAQGVPPENIVDLRKKENQ